MVLKRLNYLHYGDGMETLSKIIEGYEGTYIKSDLIIILNSKHRLSSHVIDLIKAYNGESSKTIHTDNFRQDLSESVLQKHLFAKMNCRGFSYETLTNFSFSTKLDSSINFKISLQSAKHLYYPPRLRRYLPRKHRNHIRKNNFPSIAFALGRIIDNKLYIITMQSDLFFHGPACIRDYIQGWRKILFAEILSYASSKISDIYLCRADDILKTCHPNFNIPTKTPEIWFQIYDKTAKNFNMRLVDLDEKINIQVLHYFEPEYSNTMYHLNLTA